MTIAHRVVLKLWIVYVGLGPIYNVQHICRYHYRVQAAVSPWTAATVRAKLAARSAFSGPCLRGSPCAGGVHHHAAPLPLDPEASSSQGQLRNASLPTFTATLTAPPSLGCVPRAQSHFPLNRIDGTRGEGDMYSPRKQNAFPFYNHTATYGEQLVVVPRRRGMRHLYKKVLFFPETPACG